MTTPPVPPSPDTDAPLTGGYKTVDEALIHHNKWLRTLDGRVETLRKRVNVQHDRLNNHIEGINRAEEAIEGLIGTVQDMEKRIEALSAPDPEETADTEPQQTGGMNICTALKLLTADTEKLYMFRTGREPEFRNQVRLRPADSDPKLRVAHLEAWNPMFPIEDRMVYHPVLEDLFAEDWVVAFGNDDPHMYASTYEGVAALLADHPEHQKIWADTSDWEELPKSA